MRPIGFSTGAVGYGDFRRALELLAQTSATAVELSALRPDELAPLVEAAGSLPLDRYSHVSFHVPSSFNPGFEAEICSILSRLPSQWPLVVHPDVIRNWSLWRELGSRICIENMDKRKPIGRTRDDLLAVFEELPQATFCFDIGHAHQIDPTMCEATMILEKLKDRLVEVHMSEVNTESRHDPITLEAERSFQIVAQLIPEQVPIILESRVAKPGEQLGLEVRERVEREIRLVESLFRTTLQFAAD